MSMAYRLVCFTLCAFASLVSVLADGLSVRITGPAQVDDVADLLMKVTVENTGTSALTLVDLHESVLSTMPTHTFAITHESGASPDFTGMMIRHNINVRVQNGHVTTLNPGQSVTVTHSLADAYNFTNSGPGTYEISPFTHFVAVSEGGDLQTVNATLDKSHTVTISGSKRLAVPWKSGQQEEDKHLTKRANFRGCTDDQSFNTQVAIQFAVAYTSNATGYLVNNNWPTVRFTRWFGAFHPERHDRTLTNFRSINFPGLFDSYTYDCDCGDQHLDTYAYIRVDMPGVIHLCNQFWPQLVGGSDSKAGTLIHEALHFRETANTIDVWDPQICPSGCYGKAASQLLAQQDPVRAIVNSENYMFFAENLPEDA